MRKRFLSLIATTAVMAVLFARAEAAPEIGQAAPDFTLADIHGQKHSLSDFKGKTVVLEWVNPDCPFVRKHYDKSGNLPGLQKDAAADGIVWLQINSAAAGLEGDYDNAQAAAWQQRIHASATAYLRDQTGKIGKLYDARTTPHLFIISPQGTLLYAGGIDSIRSADPTDIAKATNYVKEALADLKAGRAIRTPASKPYGCSVKYAD
ncbi:MAG: redoxin domain-containing protein [Opitutae bacterium]|nr:redoxin domain-containing protein [Opitutae bacterium]